MSEWTRAVVDAEDKYLPSGPPMNPLTSSFFWTGAFYDLCIGKSTDTMASCQICLNDLFQFNEHQMQAMRNLSQSRMGLYERVGMAGRCVRLKALLTDEEVVCLATSGYSGPWSLATIGLIRSRLTAICSFGRPLPSDRLSKPSSGALGPLKAKEAWLAKTWWRDLCEPQAYLFCFGFPSISANLEWT